MAIKWKPMKADPEFTQELERIKIERIKRGCDVDKISSARISKAIVKHSEWPKIRENIIKLPRDKRGISGQIIFIFGLALFFILAMLGYLVWALLAPFIVGQFNSVSNNVLVATGNSTPNNLSASFAPVIQAGLGLTAQLQWFSYILIIFILIAFIIFAYFQQTYRFLVVLWFFFVFIFVFIAMYISNAYQGLNNIPGSQVWLGDQFMMQFLPEIIGGVGVVMGLLLFMIPNTSDQPTARGYA